GAAGRAPSLRNPEVARGRSRGEHQTLSPTLHKGDDSMSIERHEISGHLSKVVEHNGTVYVAGTTAEDKSAGMKQQTEQVLAKIDALLARCGTNKSKLLSATVYISDMGQKAAMNE